FAEYLMDQRNRDEPSFELSPEVQRQHDEKYGIPVPLPEVVTSFGPDGLPPPSPMREEPKILANVIVGYAIANYRKRGISSGEAHKDIAVLEPGDEAILISVSAQQARGGQML